MLGKKKKKKHLSLSLSLSWVARRRPFPGKGSAAVHRGAGAGGIFGAAVLYVIASGTANFSLDGGFAANGYAEHSPGHYSLLSGFVSEAVMTFGFLFVILGSTHGRAPKGFAPLAIGLSLTLIHLVSIPVTNAVREPGSQHRDRAIRGRLGALATVDVLGCSAGRSGNRGRDVSVDGS